MLESVQNGGHRGIPTRPPHQEIHSVMPTIGWNKNQKSSFHFCSKNPVYNTKIYKNPTKNTFLLSKTAR